jgi:DNA polymerase
MRRKKDTGELDPTARGGTRRGDFAMMTDAMAKHGTILSATYRRARTRRPPAGRRRRPVFGEGPAHARVFFVGEAPGVEEARTGRPFVGRAGKFLDRALDDVGLSRDEVFVTSVVKYAPRGKRAPTRGEIEAGKPLLFRELETVDPEIVVLLGRIAEAALRDAAILDGRRVLITVHPAAAMRFPWMGRRFRRDLRTLKRWLRTR